MQSFKEGNGIGSSDPEDHKPKNLIGNEIPNQLQELTQEHQLIFEQYLAGELDIMSVERLLDVRGLTDKKIRELATDYDRLESFTQELIAMDALH